MNTIEQMRCAKALLEEKNGGVFEVENANTVYIAGKITGDPNYKGKFSAAADKLNNAGYIPLSPAVLPQSGFVYAAYIRMSAAMLNECKYVCFLPDWQQSEGARNEYTLARGNKQKIFYYDDFEKDWDKYMQR